MPRKFDVLEHELVPRHVLLSKEDAKTFLSKAGIRPSQLPWILASDPAAMVVGAEPGDIVMIIRKSPTAGRAIMFRFVMRG